MTPEKEQQIASRILERAELAQMTRQLRLNLGKANEKRKGDPDITEAIRKVSPKKTPNSRPKTYSNSKSNIDTNSNESIKRTPTPPPPPPPPSSRDANIGRVPVTPRLTDNDDVGADLLMYLATSPCASTTAPGARKVPSTPNGGFSPGDETTTVRLSHLKNPNPVSSPFKMGESPMMYTLRGSMHPTTPGRSELRFNMGDYVHNLFSPSPGHLNTRSLHTAPSLSMEKTPPPSSSALGKSSPGGHLMPGRAMRREESVRDTDPSSITDAAAAAGKNLAAEG